MLVGLFRKSGPRLWDGCERCRTERVERMTSSTTVNSRSWVIAGAILVVVVGGASLLLIIRASGSRARQEEEHRPGDSLQQRTGNEPARGSGGDQERTLRPGLWILSNPPRQRLGSRRLPQAGRGADRERTDWCWGGRHSRRRGGSIPSMQRVLRLSTRSRESWPWRQAASEACCMRPRAEASYCARSRTDRRWGYLSSAWPGMHSDADARGGVSRSTQQSPPLSCFGGGYMPAALKLTARLFWRPGARPKPLNFWTLWLRAVLLDSDAIELWLARPRSGMAVEPGRATSRPARTGRRNARTRGRLRHDPGGFARAIAVRGFPAVRRVPSQNLPRAARESRHAQTLRFGEGLKDVPLPRAPVPDPVIKGISHSFTRKSDRPDRARVKHRKPGVPRDRRVCSWIRTTRHHHACQG